jgi:hypothetical protein
MDAPALVSSPTLYVTAHGEILDAPKIDDAPKLHSGLHAFKAERISAAKTSVRPSLARRMFRACARFLIAILIGVCGTLAWQRYGDQATELAKSQIAIRAPSLAQSLAQYLPASTSAPPRLDATEQQPKPAVAAPEPASEPAAEPASNVQQEAKPVDAADATELHQRLQDVTTDLAAAKKTIEHLSATQDQFARAQEQMGQSIAKLQTLEEGLSQKLSSATSTTGAVRLPAPKPVHSRTPPSAHAAPKPVSAAPPPFPQDRLR